jgi:hypothetical protein
MTINDTSMLRCHAHTRDPSPGDSAQGEPRLATIAKRFSALAQAAVVESSALRRLWG